MSKHEKRNQLYTKAIILVWVGCIFFTMVFGFVALLKLGQAGNIEDAIIYTQNLNLSSSNAEGTRKPLDNPNDFVEDCIISTGDTHHIYDRVSVQSAALKFYEVTGCQMYYIHFDLEETDIMSEAEGEAYIKAEIPKYIDDEYSLIIYSSDGKHTGEIDKYGYEEYVYVDSGIIYGKQTRELFNADTRTIVGEIFENYWNYQDYYEDYPCMEEVVTREVAYQLFPESFPKRDGTVSNIKSYETEMIVDIDEARKEMKKNETASGVFGILMLVTMITPIVTTIVLIKRKIKVQETIDILNADIDNLDEVELRDLADKYE